MNDFVYKDYLPANARVIVDYDSKEKVKFSYPIDWTYKKAVWKCAYHTVLQFWMGIHNLPICYISIYLILPYYLITGGIALSKGAPLQENAYIIVFPLFSFYFLGIPAIYTFYLARDKKKLAETIPKLGKWAGKVAWRTKKTIFFPDNVTNKMVIIPSFSNVYLNYKCEGDFNKYLKRIEILEIPFNFIHRRFFFPFLWKEERNQYDFRAVFHFSDTPNNGQMNVEFN